MRFPKRRPDTKKSPPKTAAGLAVQPSQPEPVMQSPADLPDDLIAARAHEIWRRRGCPMGQDGTQDWFAARAELEQERLGWAAPRDDDRERRPG